LKENEIKRHQNPWKLGLGLGQQQRNLPRMKGRLAASGFSIFDGFRKSFWLPQELATDDHCLLWEGHLRGIGFESKAK